jgi:aldose 1-epimerase
VNISQQPFGHTPDALPVDLYTLVNDAGLTVRITNYGGIIVSVLAPDRSGTLADVVLGFETLAGYLQPQPFLGALVGRYANRIARGRFTLNGVDYVLAQNDGANHLHGGVKGFDKMIWQAKPFESGDEVGLRLHYQSVAGEEGYPGTVDVQVVYTLTNDQALKIDYTATTEQDTIINLTNYAYFNLAGSGDVLQHEVMLNADHFTPVNKTLIPTGELRPVVDTRAKYSDGKENQPPLNKLSASPFKNNKACIPTEPSSPEKESGYWPRATPLSRRAIKNNPKIVAQSVLVMLTFLPELNLACLKIG